MRIVEKKRGVALIWAVVVSTVLLLITTTMVNSTLKESRISLRTDSSTVAYAAANSGIEIGKKMIDAKAVNPNDTPTYAIDVVAGVNAKVNYTKDAKGNWIISSTGSVGDVSRKLEYKYIAYTPSRIKFTDIATASYPNNGSYTQKFSFWFPTGTRPGQFDLGYSNVASTNAVWLSYVEDSGSCSSQVAGKRQKVTLNYKNTSFNGGNPVASTAICLGAYGINVADYNGDFKRFIPNIRYVDGAAVQLVLNTYDFNSQTTTCTASVSLPLSAVGFDGFSKTLSKIFYNASPAAITAYQLEMPYKFEIKTSTPGYVDIESLQIYN